MSIDITKKYETWNGLCVDILKIYEDDQKYPVKAYVYPENKINSGRLLEYTLEGKCYAIDCSTVHDLVEVSPLDSILQLLIDANVYFSASSSVSDDYNEACEKIRSAINLLITVIKADTEDK